MADAADPWRAIAYAVRSLPAAYGLRPYAVSLVRGHSTGAHTGDGQVFEEETPILEQGGTNPRVRWKSDEQIAVGALGKGTIEIGPITPQFSGGGTSSATLLAAGLNVGETFHVRVTGPNHPTGALYRVVGINLERAIHYSITAEPVSEMQP